MFGREGRAGRPGRPRVEAAVDLRARVWPYGPVGERGRAARRGLRPQPGRDRGGAGRGGLQPRRRTQVRGGTWCAHRRGARAPGRWPRSSRRLDDIAAVVEEHNAASAGIDVSVAVDNGAQQVISGPADAIDTILERFESEGTRVARLRKSPAYHSAMIEPALDGLEESIREIPFAPPSITLLSNVTGAAVAPDAILDTAYWRRHARERVQFRSCVEELASLGVDAVVELGPHAVLGPDDGARLAGVGGRAPGGGREPHAPARGDAGRRHGGRVRRRRRRDVRSRHSRATRGAVRRRVAPPGLVAGLSVPARTLLGGEAASPGRRRPSAAREPARLGPPARRPSTPRFIPPIRRGSAIIASSVASSHRARSTVRWQPPWRRRRARSPC